MKCPKCGFNSFEAYDACKKCGNDLVAFKAAHGIRAIVFPPGAAAPAVQETVDEAAAPESEEFSWDTAVTPSAEAPKAAADEFSFDFSSSSAAPQPEADDGGFSFDDCAPEPAAGAPAAAATGGPQEFSFDDFSGGTEEHKEGSQDFDLGMEGFSFDDEEEKK